MNIETAGLRLKKIRQERGFSLEDIQKKTKIHLNILRAIEGDSVSNLSPIYLKGFIKIYCNFLGLDTKDFIGEGTKQDKPVLNATIGRPIGERVEKKASFIKDTSVRLVALRPEFNIKKIIIAAVLVIISLFLLSSLFKLISSRRKSPAQRAKILMPVSPRAIDKKNKTKKPLTQNFTLQIFARNKSWISAKVDGKVIFHGVLARGRSETWYAKEKVELSLGDAGAVELQVNDQRFSSLGRRGQPLKNVLINKDGLKIFR